MQCDRICIFRFDDARHNPPVTIENRWLIFLGHHGAWIDDIAEQIIQICPIGTRKFGTNIATCCEEHVALLTRLSKDRAAKEQIRFWFLGGLNQRFVFFDKLGLLGWRFPHCAPVLFQQRFDSIVFEILQLANQISAEITGCDLLGINGFQHGDGIFATRREGCEGRSLFILRQF